MVNCLLILFFLIHFFLNGIIFSKSYFVLIIRIIFSAVVTLRVLGVFLLLSYNTKMKACHKNFVKVYKLYSFEPGYYLHQYLNENSL